MRLPDPTLWQSKRVLVTGHLGFKGSWLCAWLSRMDAETAIRRDVDWYRGHASGSPAAEQIDRDLDAYLTSLS
jgi:nucleoside-diphosphate-sugar epimerase